MSPRCALVAPPIQQVLEAFLRERRSVLQSSDFQLYRRVLFFLELCINNYGHRNLNEEERDLCERHYHARGAEQRHFFEVFGVDKLLPELDFFATTYLKKDVYTSERIEKKAPEVVVDLRRWLVTCGHLDERSIEQAAERSRQRSRLRYRCRKAVRLLKERVLSIDRLEVSAEDYIGCDDHIVARIEPRKLWLRVYRSAEPEEIGPLLVPREATKHLRVGWNLCCALARVKGRWRLVELEDVHPRL